MTRPTTWGRSAALAALALALTATTAIGAVRIGTDGSDTLTGTHGNDQITGKAGDDTLKGLAGNDTYAFDDNFGADTVEDWASYKVDGKKRPGGIDTLSFSQLNSDITVQLIPEWGSGFNRAWGSGGTVDLGRSRVENVVGGQGNDGIVSGAGKNTLQPGGGGSDGLYDYGGRRHTGNPHVALPASDDVYKGFGKHGGMVTVADWGGSADVVDLRPFSTADVYLDKADLDGDENRTEESLLVVTGETTGVWLAGHFGPVNPYANTGQQGRIEKLIFADGTVDASEAASLAAASAEAVRDGKGADLAKAADRLADQARQHLRQTPLPGDDPNQALERGTHAVRDAAATEHPDRAEKTPPQHHGPRDGRDAAEGGRRPHARADREDGAKTGNQAKDNRDQGQDRDAAINRKSDGRGDEHGSRPGG